MGIQSPTSLAEQGANSSPSTLDAATAWQAFVHYVIRFCGSGYMIANISILVRYNVPVAWRVAGQPVDAFYSNVEGGDIQRQWTAFSRHLLAKCSGNSGFGIIDIDGVAVHRGRPIMWPEAGFKKIHPAEVAEPGGYGEEIIYRVLYPQYVRNI